MLYMMSYICSQRLFWRGTYFLSFLVFFLRIAEVVIRAGNKLVLKNDVYLID